MSLRIGILVVGSCAYRYEPSVSIQKQEMRWLAEQLSASKQRLRSDGIYK
jgi:hypothetical protein